MRLLVLVMVGAGLIQAAPVTVFDDDPTPGDGGFDGSVLRVGADAAGGYAELDAAAAAGAAMRGPAGSIPTVATGSLSGTALRIAVGGEGVGWWEAELPVPAEARQIPLAGGRLGLAIKGSRGHESIEVGLSDAAFPRHQVRIPLARYGPIERGWTVYRIPLEHFLALDPELNLNRLATVGFFSARPEPSQVFVDQVILEPAPLAVAPVRLVHEATDPTAPTTPPPPIPPPTAEVEIVQPSATSRDGADTVPIPPAPQPEQPAQPAPPAPQPEQPTQPAQPAPPVPQPEQPALPATPQPVKPAGEVPREPVVEPVAGPAPDSPVKPTGPVKLPDELRPMLPVSFFYTDADTGASGWDASQLRATWATNQGERGFDATELKETFAVADGDRLPLVMVEEPGRTGTVLHLQAKKPGFAWWVAEIGRAEWEVSDEQAYLRNGQLEFAIRGLGDDPQVRVGLIDAQAQPQVALVPSSTFGTITEDWQILRVPLRALKTANPDLDWSRIRAVQLASANGRPLELWLDDLRIVNPVSGGPED